MAFYKTGCNWDPAVSARGLVESWPPSRQTPRWAGTCLQGATRPGRCTLPLCSHKGSLTTQTNATMMWRKESLAGRGEATRKKWTPGNEALEARKVPEGGVEGDLRLLFSVYVPGTKLSILRVIFYLLPATFLRNRYYYYFHSDLHDVKNKCLEGLNNL